MNIFLSFIVGIVTVLSGYGFYTDTTPREMFDNLGSTMTGSAWFLNASQQIQAGAVTWGLRIPSLGSSGDCLTTDVNGVVTTSTCGSGSGGSNWTPISGGLRTSTSTDFAQAAYFIATSTTGTSSFAGNMTVNGNTRLATSLTGLLKGTSGVVSVASSGTDYEVPLTFSTGLTRTTNNIAPTTGYNIPLTASTTNWNGFYDTPSTRITAGTGVDWSGNILNGVYTAGDGITLNTEDFDCDTASGSIFGCLSSTDWNIFNNKLASTSIDTSAELATILTDETGTAGNLVFSNNPLLAGFRSNASSTIGDGTGAGGLTINGGATTTLNQYIGGNLSVFDRVTFDNTDFNTKIGYQAGKNIVAGAQYNTFSGYQAGFSSSTAASTTADYNSAFGYRSLYSNTTGNYNTANGYASLYSNTTGYYNTAIGESALYNNTTGYYNTAIGESALYSNTTGSQNTANGMESLVNNTTGNYNTANGTYALRSNTSGSNNTALGYNAGRYYGSGTSANQTSSSSVYLGYSTRAGANGNINEIVIGHTAIGSGSNSVTLGSTTITDTILRGNVSVGTNATSSTSFFSALGTFTNMVVNALATFLNVVVTGLLDVGGGVLEIPNGASPTVDATGEIALNTTTNSLSVATSTTALEIPLYPPVRFSFASSTWTGTTTKIAYVTEPNFDELITSGICFADGTGSIIVGNGTASSSATALASGTTTVNVNKRFNKNGTRIIYAIGTPTTLSTVQCTFRRVFLR